MRYLTAILAMAALIGMANAQFINGGGELSPFCDGMDICSWSTDMPNDEGLPLGAPEPGACSQALAYRTYWPIGSGTNPSDSTVTCTFTRDSEQAATLYLSIEEDVLDCTLNDKPIGSFPIHNDGCPNPDPVDGGHQAAFTAAQGSNTLICHVRDTGGNQYFNACVVTEHNEPLPEFGSGLIPLAILAIVPAIAYAAVSRRRQ